MTQDAKGQDDPNKGGGTGDPGKKPGANDQPDIDPTIASIMKDPDAIQKLLDQKRTANAEARQFREQIATMKADQAKRDDAQMLEQGKFKELAEKSQAKVGELQSAYSKRAKSIALMIEAMKEGIIDPDGIKLVDDSALTVGDDFTVEGASEAIKKLKESKPYLFQKTEDEPPPDGDGAPRPGIRGRITTPDDDKLSPEARLLRYFSGGKKKP